MTSMRSSSSVDGLPKQFVTSLRVLFDILDEDRTGYVRLCDIESRWHDEGVRGLPSGVIDTLRKVAPKTGKLSFENFVTGLKFSLLKTNTTSNDTIEPVRNGKEKLGSRSNAQHSKTKERPHSTPINVTTDIQRNQKPTDVYRSNHEPSRIERKQVHQTVKPIVQKGNAQMPSQSVPSNVNSNTATVRPNNVLQSHNVELRNQIYTREQLHVQQAAIKPKVEQPSYRGKDRKYEQSRSQPRYPKQSDEVTYRGKEFKDQQKQRPKSVELHRTRDFSVPVNNHKNDFLAGRPDRPPPYRSPEGRPERPPPYRRTKDIDSPPAIPPRNVQKQIMQELKTWQQDHKTGQQKREGHMHNSQSDSKLLEKGRNSGNDIYVNIEQIRKHATNFKTTGAGSSNNMPQKTTSVRRQNSRRHTLSNGIDYNVIRRMKQLEQEKDVLLQGLEVVERAQDWYLKQVAKVTEKQNYAEKTSCSDVTLQANQDRMDFVRGRITDVNLNLKSLMESTEKGFPAHMNLAVKSNVFSEEMSVKWLKDQNKQLTKEVGSKSDKITQLEKEKASLIRDLFETRSKHKTTYDDTTFM